MKKKILFSLLLMVGCFGMLSAQMSENSTRSGKSTLSVNGGMLFLANDAGTTPIIGVSWVDRWTCFKRDNRPIWCSFIKVDFWRTFIFKDPWRLYLPDWVNDPFPIPQPEPDPYNWGNFDLGELEIGAGWLFDASVGLDFSVSDQFDIGVYAGGGFHYTESQTTEIDGQGTFSTFDRTTPLLTFGVDAGYDINDRVSVSVGFQGFNTFESNMEVTGPDGSVATFAGMSMLTPGVNIGLGFNL